MRSVNGWKKKNNKDKKHLEKSLITVKKIKIQNKISKTNHGIKLERLDLLKNQIVRQFVFSGTRYNY